MELVSPAYTRALGEVIREIEPDQSQYLGIKYMPAVERPTTDVWIDIWQRTGGMTLEHTTDGDAMSIQKRGFRTQKFSSGAYREFIRFGEGDILRLRELGTNDLSKRGIQQHIEENARRLNTRIETRMEFLRWQAIFQGSYVYDGKVVDFKVPAANQVSPINNWATGSGGTLAVNPAADPISDLRYWLMGGYQAYLLYGTPKAMVMNPNTARMILQNAKVQQQINPAIQGGRLTSYDVNGILQFLIPGLPQVTVYNGVYQAEAIDPVTGALTTGPATYFIPDGKIFFETNLPDGNKVGEIQMTLNLSSGNINAPTAGKFLLTDTSGLQSQIAAPWMALVSGFNGGPALTRAFDLLTATVF